MHFPVRIDAAIGAGVPPGVRLQRALRDPQRLTRLDYLLTGVCHGLWLAPHAALGWLLLRDPERVPRIAGRLAGVYHLTTLGYRKTTRPSFMTLAVQNKGCIRAYAGRATRAASANTPVCGPPSTASYLPRDPGI